MIEADYIKTIIAYGVIPGIIGTVSYMIKTLLNRVESLEKEVPNKLDEREVRQLLGDKIDPLREDIHDLKGKIDRIMELLIKGS